MKELFQANTRPLGDFGREWINAPYLKIGDGVPKLAPQAEPPISADPAHRYWPASFLVPRGDS